MPKILSSKLFWIILTTLIVAVTWFIYEPPKHIENLALEQRPSQSSDNAASNNPTCLNWDGNRRAYFGDLHVHTTFSFDAYAYGVKTLPDDAYRFAKGEPIAFLPIDDNGKMTGSITIDRPLDFLAVTDHAEYLGEYHLCTSEDLPSYHTDYCQSYRAGGYEAIRMTAISLAMKIPYRLSSVCHNREQCVAASRTPWQQIIASAERAQDKTNQCQFSAFVGYEYSGAPESSNYHRNVIFRNANVPELPISRFEAPLDYNLWQQLNQSCQLDNGCDYLTIPHNANLSNGKLLAPYADLKLTETNKKAYANLRLQREPIMEIFQHKGNSECANGFPGILGSPDELCDLEQIRYVGKQGKVKLSLGRLVVTPEKFNPTRYCDADEKGFGGMQGNGCLSQNDFYRTALLTGLEEQKKLGLDPVKLGASASTDSHMSTSAVQENNWRGHIHEEWYPKGRLKSGFIPSGKEGNPGGLTGLWAQENSRDSLFDAMLRRESFGTSGPRIKPRFFAGWDLPKDICDAPDMIDQAYRLGVPMGADLVATNSQKPPTFLLSANADSHSAPLQKLQIIKGWVSVAGQQQYKVYDVAGDFKSDAYVDLTTGKAYGKGYSSLCGTFTDPDFDSDENAYYYMRAVENPTPRWSLLDCLSFKNPTDKPEACSDPKVATSIQEQAWTSPIWHYAD